MNSVFQSGRNRLFGISFLILFWELACIRWFGSTVLFLTFFTNIVLMACFLGMATGCICATGKRDFTRWVLPLMLVASTLAWLSLALYSGHSRLSIDVGAQASPQQIFFGTEYQANDPSKIAIPIELIAAVFFILIALIFVGLGQIMGRAFNAVPDRLKAYTSDIAGSLSGIAVFGLASWAQTPPLLWFGISIALWLWLKRADDALSASTSDGQNTPTRRPNRVQSATQALAIVGILLMVTRPDVESRTGAKTFWSPYYKINYLPAPDYLIETNNIGHQEMHSISENGPAYALPHLLHRDAGQPSFDDVLIIGAGSGNDVQAARQFGAKRIDAVEIDPAIQSLGRQFHPDQPYSDPRVSVHLDDGRSFVKRTNKKYDLVIYALVDSLVLHSGYSSLRLESFLFTQQAMQEIKSKLKPGGMFAMYNFYRQGWVVTRLAKTAETVFGSKPLVFSLPYRPTITPTQAQFGRYTFILCGDTDTIAQQLKQKQFFWLNTVPALNFGLNGYNPQAPKVAIPQRFTAQTMRVQPKWMRVGTAQVDTSNEQLLPDDNWPFLYLREPSIPALNWRGIALMGGLSLGLLWLLAPISILPNRNNHSENGVARRAFNWPMFFLGAGFMLLETKSVVHMALLFGSTWIVNSFVFASVLTMILIANLWVSKTNPQRLTIYYILLFVSLLVGVLVPMNSFLSLPGALKIGASCLVTFAPIFFAGVIFASRFRHTTQPDVDFGSNTAGIILGGLCEYSSLALGFNGLLGVAMLFYAFSLWRSVRLQTTGNASGP